jgi:hypothetical protein
MSLRLSAPARCASIPGLRENESMFGSAYPGYSNGGDPTAHRKLASIGRPHTPISMILSGCRGWRSRPWGIRTDTLQPVVWPNTPANARIEPSIFSWPRKQKGSPPGGRFPFGKWLNGALNRNQACLRQIVSAGKRCLPVAISRGAASQSLVVSTQVWKCGACLWCSKACSLV